MTIGIRGNRNTRLLLVEIRQSSQSPSQNIDSCITFDPYNTSVWFFCVSNCWGLIWIFMSKSTIIVRSARNFEIQLRYSLFRGNLHMQETIIVNVSHIVHHNGSTEKDQQITSRAEVGENRHESRCNSPINLVKIASELDTVVNVQFP